MPSSEHHVPVNRLDLQAYCAERLAQAKAVGWRVRLRAPWRYYPPDYWYEALLRKLVGPTTKWLDVGGGRSPLPSNPSLAAELTSKARRFVVVDPSPNVRENPYASEIHQGSLEQWSSTTCEKFDLVTLRFVAEHVSEPDAFVASLARSTAPGGFVIVYTVYKWSPASFVSGLLPFQLHHPIKSLFWSGEERDTFPTSYLMNTRAELKRLFQSVGFREIAFREVDHLVIFGRWKLLYFLELMVWHAISSMGCRYPERNLIAVYRREEASMRNVFEAARQPTYR